MSTRAAENKLKGLKRRSYAYAAPPPPQKPQTQTWPPTHALDSAVDIGSQAFVEAYNSNTAPSKALPRVIFGHEWDKLNPTERQKRLTILKDRNKDLKRDDEIRRFEKWIDVLLVGGVLGLGVQVWIRFF
ncbi:hypothetical protein BDV96DRAFT_648923 [Lophiotrema nucula]|uniref:Uncharacterized protein n=1 Tax=Lophiotrema nucula TaxID=690887 RepID=A0A6A5Z1E4_9PLEO|nr:hypothetical protein BDV96DRAFT_648923 [Lophiotrema nucula]